MHLLRYCLISLSPFFLFTFLLFSSCAPDCNTPFGEGAVIDTYQPEFASLSNVGGTVTINSSTLECTITAPEGSTITYTTDGTTPVTDMTDMAGSTQHGTHVDSNSTTIDLSEYSDDVTVKAVCQKPGYQTSKISAAVYRHP